MYLALSCLLYRDTLPPLQEQSPQKQKNICIYIYVYVFCFIVHMTCVPPSLLVIPFVTILVMLVLGFVIILATLVTLVTLFRGSVILANQVSKPCVF